MLTIINNFFYIVTIYIVKIHKKERKMTFKMVELPYKKDALEPYFRL